MWKCRLMMHFFFYTAKEKKDPEAVAGKMAEKRENLDKLQNAFVSLTDEEKELIWLLYLCKEPLTETQVASMLHISQQAVNKRKQKILEKMKVFWRKTHILAAFMLNAARINDAKLFFVSCDILPIWRKAIRA